VTAKAEVHRGALDAIERVLNRGGDADEVLREVVGILHDRLDHFSWAGIYLVEGDDLVLGPWKGPEATEHIRIPVGQGICGAAAATGRTEVVDDVNADPRYVACFPSTRSEIVVPIAFKSRVVGEIDVDSDLPAAFSDEDKTFLERVATLPARLRTTPELELVTFLYNRRDPEVMKLIVDHCDAINARGLRTRSGRRLRLQVDPAPLPRVPPPRQRWVNTGDRFARGPAE
jgi:GAF domain-containing protein